MWIARDSLGALMLFAEKPHKTYYRHSGHTLFSLSPQECQTHLLEKNTYFWEANGMKGNDAACQVLYLNPELYPEVNFENSPIELKIV